MAASGSKEDLPYMILNAGINPSQCTRFNLAVGERRPTHWAAEVGPHDGGHDDLSIMKDTSMLVLMALQIMQAASRSMVAKSMRLMRKGESHDICYWSAGPCNCSVFSWQMFCQQLLHPFCLLAQMRHTCGNGDLAE